MNLETEVSRLSEERDYYRELLIKRPIEIKASAEIIDPLLHPELTIRIQDKLKAKERFYCKILINNEKLWCIPIGFLDKSNDEESEIFLAILDNNPISDTLEFNDLVKFQSCDVVDIRNS